MVPNIGDKEARVNALAERLMGTYQSIAGEDLDVDEAEMLDTLVLECRICGWWSEPDEIDDGICEDCWADGHD